jgi:hypothetical protein
LLPKFSNIHGWLEGSHARKPDDICTDRKQDVISLTKKKSQRGIIIVVVNIIPNSPREKPLDPKHEKG